MFLDEVTDEVEALHATLFSSVLKSSYAKSMEQAQATFNTISTEVKSLSKAIEAFDAEITKFQIDKKALTVLKNKNDLLASSYVSTLYSIAAHIESIESESNNNLEGIFS